MSDYVFTMTLVCVGIILLAVAGVFIFVIPRPERVIDPFAHIGVIPRLIRRPTVGELMESKLAHEDLVIAFDAESAFAHYQPDEDAESAFASYQPDDDDRAGDFDDYASDSGSETDTTESYESDEYWDEELRNLVDL